MHLNYKGNINTSYVATYLPVENEKMGNTTTTHYFLRNVENVPIVNEMLNRTNYI